MAEIDEAFRSHMRGVARALDEVFNGAPGRVDATVGFCLFTFNFGNFSDGQVNFISNADRQTMIAAIREWLARAEQGEGVIYSPTKPFN